MLFILVLSGILFKVDAGFQLKQYLVVYRVKGIVEVLVRFYEKVEQGHFLLGLGIQVAL